MLFTIIALEMEDDPLFQKILFLKLAFEELVTPSPGAAVLS
jgi:hypothetical protein